MSRRMCVMCELASTVDIMPIGKSLNNFGLLSREIFHDLHKSNMNEGIKWRGLLHSINFQENKLARLSLIELLRINHPEIAEELEKPEHIGQFSCICGLRTNGPRLKRSNSLSHIAENSMGSGDQTFSFESSQIGVFNQTFPRFAPPEEGTDDRWKYMSLQPLKSPVFPVSKTRRRSRSLEILRPFTALERETFIPRENYDSSSESESMDDEIDHIFRDISNLNKDYIDGGDDDFVNTTKQQNVAEKTVTSSRGGQLIREDRLDSEENIFTVSSGFQSTSSVDTVVHMSVDGEKNEVFPEESRSEVEQERNSIRDLRDENIGSPDMESTREDISVTLENDVTMKSSKSAAVHTLLEETEKIAPSEQEPLHKDVIPTSQTHFRSGLPDRNPVIFGHRNKQVPANTDQDYTVLGVFVSVLVTVGALGLYFLPEPLLSSIIVLGLLQWYTTKTRS